MSLTLPLRVNSALLNTLGEGEIRTRDPFTDTVFPGLRTRPTMRPLHYLERRIFGTKPKISPIHF